MRDLRCLKILISKKKWFERSFKKERKIYKGDGRFYRGTRFNFPARELLGR